MLGIFTTSLWPHLVKLCLNGLGSSCVQLLSNTAALALSQMKQFDDAFLDGLLEMCRSRFLDGGHCLVGPLGVAIASQFVTAQQSEKLLSTVEYICSRDRCQSISNLFKADEVLYQLTAAFALGL